MPTLRRRFTLLDAMILIAATAEGYALDSALRKPLAPHVGDSGLVLFAYAAAMATAYFLSCWTFAVLILRLRSPLPSIRRLRRQPGLISSLVAMLLWAVYGCLAIWDRAIWARYRVSSHWIPLERDEVVAAIALHAGWVVAAAWIALVIARACRPEPSWIDRAGLNLGAC